MPSESVLEGDQDAKFSTSDYDILYRYWNDLPIVKYIPHETFQLVGDHPYRQGIVQILRKGIPDTNGKKRHALSLKELIDPLEELISSDTGFSTKIKLTALYHHRDKLLEEELIQEVATFLEGKRYVAYYGRTAKAFLGEEYKTGKKIKGEVDLLEKLAVELSGRDEEKLTPIMDKRAEETKIAADKTIKWIEDHVDLINRLDLDPIELFELIIPFFAYNTENSDSIRKLIGLDTVKT